MVLVDATTAVDVVVVTVVLLSISHYYNTTFSFCYYFLHPSEVGEQQTLMFKAEYELFFIE